MINFQQSYRIDLSSLQSQIEVLTGFPYFSGIPALLLSSTSQISYLPTDVSQLMELLQSSILNLSKSIYLIIMQNPLIEDAEIIQKVSLKQKLVVKAAIPEKSEVFTAKFGAEDSIVACGYGDGRLVIYNLLKNTKIADINTNAKQNEHTPINILKWRPTHESMHRGVLLVANTNGHLYQYIAKSGKELHHSIEQGNQIMAMDYSGDARHFATAGKDVIVRVYDEETKKVTCELKSEYRTKMGHINRIFGLKWKSDNVNLLASGGWDQNVDVWDLRVKEAVATLVGPKITGDAIDFRDDLILTGASRVKEQLQVWDYRTKEVLHTFEWEEGKKETNAFLNSCQFCANSTNTVIAAGGSQMKMFTLDDHRELFQVRTHKQGESIYTCDSSAANNKYILGGKGGTLFYLATGKGSE